LDVRKAPLSKRLCGRESRETWGKRKKTVCGADVKTKKKKKKNIELLYVSHEGRERAWEHNG